MADKLLHQAKMRALRKALNEEFDQETAEGKYKDAQKAGLDAEMQDHPMPLLKPKYGKQADPAYLEQGQSFDDLRMSLKDKPKKKKRDTDDEEM